MAHENATNETKLTRSSSFDDREQKNEPTCRELLGLRMAAAIFLYQRFLIGGTQLTKLSKVTKLHTT